MKKRILFSIAVLFCVFFSIIPAASAWHDETHLAIAKAAGYPKWYNAAGPDLAKIKAGFIEVRNHYSDNRGAGEVTPEMVLEQVGRYNDPDDKDGHLYGAVIASLRAYTKSRKEGRYSHYHLAYCAHYLGDLSQPLHNSPPDEFNKIHHGANDGVVEKQVLQKIGKIETSMYPINLRSEHFEKDLAGEIARIANMARKLDNKLRKDNRNLSQEEAYRQLGHSASLLKAVLHCLNRND